MLVTEPGMVYDDVVLPAGEHINWVLSLLKRTPFSDEYTVLSFSTFIFVRLVHLVNTYKPMLVTELGIVTDVNFVQPLNAELPMLVMGKIITL